MEKFKSILGLIAMSVVVLGVLFKFLHFPGTGMLIIIGGSSLALYTYVLSGVVQARFQKKQEGYLRNLFKKSTFLSISVTILIAGLLYFILLWPGARLMLLVGSASVAVSLIFYAYAFYMKQERIKITWPAIYIIIGVLALLLGAASTADRLAEMHQQEQSTIQE